jgi:HD domain
MTAISLPDSPIAVAALDYAVKLETPAIANHSVRSFLFATLYAQLQGIELDRDVPTDLLFCATVLHDLGLTDSGNRENRFEVDGANLAAEFLTGQGIARADVDAVWDAIALHTSFGITEHKGPLCALTYGGIMLDFGHTTEFIPDDVATAIHAQYPRHQMAKSLADTIVAQARQKESKAPRFSMIADLLRQRTADVNALTDMEQLAGMGRWGS